MIKLILDFTKGEIQSLGEESAADFISFSSIPERALLLQALARLRKMLRVKINERIVVEINGGTVQIKREGEAIQLPTQKVELMLDEVKKNMN